MELDIFGSSFKLRGTGGQITCQINKSVQDFHLVYVCVGKMVWRRREGGPISLPEIISRHTHSHLSLLRSHVLLLFLGEKVD